MTDTTATTTQIEQEFARLGLAARAVATPCGTVLVTAEGWPDAIVYTPATLLPILCRYPDGHMRTEEGDAEVCAAIEAAGALVPQTS